MEACLRKHGQVWEERLGESSRVHVRRDRGLLVLPNVLNPPPAQEIVRQLGFSSLGLRPTNVLIHTKQRQIKVTIRNCYRHESYSTIYPKE